MKWIDQAGYACAVGWSGQYCVTVYVGGFRFYRPVLIGRTSMHVVVEVGARDPRDRLRTTTTTRCVIVFVAVDEQGNPVEVAKWRPETEEDAALERYALKLTELRKGIEESVANLRGAGTL